MNSTKKYLGIFTLLSLSVIFTACPSDGPEETKPNPPSPTNISDGGNTSNTNGDSNSGGNNSGSSNSGGSPENGSGNKIATSFSGNGTQNNPYIISNAPELRKLANDVNSGKSYNKEYFKLTANVVINRNVLDSDGYPNTSVTGMEEWKPIGNSERNSFCGVFDGNGYSVSGIYINAPTQDAVGLFGYLSGEIKNLSIKDSYIYGHKGCGGITGRIVTYTSEPKLLNCSNYGYIAGYYIGGILGENEESNCIVDRCKNYGIIDVRSWTGLGGGIGGYCNKTIFTNCMNYGLVESEGPIGGIAGFSKEYGGQKIYNCVNFGDLNSAVQGRCGITSGDPNNIENCVNYGTCYFGIAMSVSYPGKVLNTYFLNITCETGRGTNESKVKSSQCKGMTGVEMQAQSFLNELNKNATTLGTNYARWKFGSDGFPTLDI